MATFFLLPPRRVVGEYFQTFLGSLFPGLPWSGKVLPDLAEELGEAARSQGNVYVVYQEDLPEDVPPATGLLRDFGAEEGDEVVEVRPMAGGHLKEAGRWRLPILA